MRIAIDTARGRLETDDGKSLELYSKEAFELISELWLKVSWAQKYSYTFTWFGRPIIQLPEDIVRLQEVIFALKPDVIVETGVAHGGSLVFYASLFKAMGRGRAIGVDIEIRPHNRTAIETHPLASAITLIEGSSVDPRTVAQVKAQIAGGEKVMVILDSNHSRDHVRAELEAYCPLVSVGSYIVACDGIMRDLQGTPGSRDDWTWNNPTEAAREFAGAHPEFALAPPAFRFDEGKIAGPLTYWPDAYLRRIR